MGFDIGKIINGGIEGAKRLVKGAEEAVDSAVDTVVDAGEDVVHLAKDAFAKTGDLVMSAERSLADLAREAKDKLVEEGKELLGMDPVDLEITRDPLDANDDPGDAILDAQRKLDAGKSQEASALSKLSTEDQAAYQKVANRISNDTRARQTLQQMLLDGKLPGEKDPVGGQTLLENLEAISEQSVASGIDQGALVADLVQEIADPSCIDQQLYNTCGATTAQIVIARQNPSEYARIVAGLASPEGQVKIKSGATLKRDPDWSAADGGRTLSSQLIQPAFMDHSNGGIFDYTNAKDGRKLGPWSVPGMLPNEMAKVLHDVTGKSYDHLEVVSLNPLDSLKFGLCVDKLKKAAPGKEVPIMVNYADQESAVVPHWLLVTGVKDGKVNYINPWGREESMSVNELRRHLIAYVPEG